MIRVGASVSDPGLEIPALIDSGSDQTFIPDYVFQTLTFKTVGKAVFQSAVGVMESEQYSAVISVDGLPAVVLRIAAFDFKDHAVLGRDYLNEFKVTLDGSNLLFSIE